MTTTQQADTYQFDPYTLVAHDSPIRLAMDAVAAESRLDRRALELRVELMDLCYRSLGGGYSNGVVLHPDLYPVAMTLKQQLLSIARRRARTAGTRTAGTHSV